MRDAVMEINIHRVSKIEVKKRSDLANFSTRDIVIHSKEYDFETRKYIDRTLELNCFLNDKSVAKLVYTD
jgi:hypothetical protein